MYFAELELGFLFIALWLLTSSALFLVSLFATLLLSVSEDTVKLDHSVGRKESLMVGSNCQSASKNRRHWFAGKQADFKW